MTTPAVAPATPEAPQPNSKGVAPPPAAAVEADEAPLPPLDPDAEIGEQIKRSAEVVARAERKKAKAAKASEKKGKAPTAAAKTEEPVPDTEPAPPLEETEEPEQPEGSAASILVKARLLVEKDPEAAFKLAFGKDAAAFRINSARWTEWSKKTTETKREFAQREQRLEAAAAKLEQKYGRWAEAEKLYEAEDYEGAFSKAFKTDLNSFQRKALAKYHGKNPDVEAARREVAELKAELARKEQEQEQRALQHQEQQQHAANQQAIAGHLGVSDDPQLAALAKKPRFIGRVYKEFLQRVDAGEPPSMLLVAACAEDVRDGIVGEFGDVFVPGGQSLSGGPRRDGTIPGGPRQVGKEPGRQGSAAAAPTTLSQRGASEASAPTVTDRLLTEEEEIAQIRKFSDLMRSAS